MLLTPMLSANPLAVPTVGHKRSPFTADKNHFLQEKNNIRNIIRNWSEKPPDLINQTWSTIKHYLKVEQNQSPPSNLDEKFNGKSSKHSMASFSVSSVNSSLLFHRKPQKRSSFNKSINSSSINFHNNYEVFNHSVNSVKFTNFSVNSNLSSVEASEQNVSITHLEKDYSSIKGYPTVISTTSFPETSSLFPSQFLFNIKNGYIFLLVLVTAFGIVALGLFGVVRCLSATGGASRALALPIPLLPEDLTPLNAEPDHPVPMLSVQSPGCAGMERLGVPTRSSLGPPPCRDDRSRRLRIDTTTFPTHHDLIVSNRDATKFSDRQTNRNGTLATNNLKNHYHNHYHKNSHNHHYTNKCPHHVALPDGEWGPDKDLKIRTSCQQSEIPRTYVKAPPNKTVQDVPGQQYMFTSTSSCNLSQRGLSIDNNSLTSLATIPSSSANNLQQKHDKSKPFYKLFFQGSKTPKASNNNNNSQTYAMSSGNNESSRGLGGSINSNLTISSSNLLMTTNNHQYQQSLLSSSVPTTMTSINLGTSTSLSASPSPDTSTHYM